MKITIRPDQDCIKLIRSGFKEMIIDFLKSLGIAEKDAKNWEATHTIEINEKSRPFANVFHMKCFLPDELFSKPEWVFKVSEEEFNSLFVISGSVVCCWLCNTEGLKTLPKNLLNLLSGYYDCETLNEWWQELLNCQSLKSISFSNCKKLKDISLLGNLINLQILNLCNCESLTDISSLSRLVNLRTINLSFCKSLTNISDLSGLENLQMLNLKNCISLKDIQSLSKLLNLKNIYLSGCIWLADITSLSGLVNLRTLDLSRCGELEDISSLSGLVNLRTLDLSSCGEFVDISSLSGLVNLRTLDLSSCESLTDLSSLAGLSKLQTLNLSLCESLSDVSGLAGLLNLRSLNFVGCKSIKDISSLAGLLSLQSLDLSGCTSLTVIRSLSGLLNLQTLKLMECFSLNDISGLAGLLNLQTLRLDICKLIIDIKSLSSLVNLQTLYLSGCESLTDISSLAGLANLQSLHLSYCESLINISPLSCLVNLQSLHLGGNKLLTELSSLEGLKKIHTLDISDSKRIRDYSPLRKCLSLKIIYGNNMDPTEFSELISYLAVQRKDILFISEKADSWLQELELALGQNHPSTNDLASSLAQGIILANLDEVGLSFHQTLLNQPNVGLSPWKIWFSENLKTFGWDKIQKLAELNKPSELTFGAIGGISSCLPSLEGNPVQIGWAKKWISEIHSLHNTSPTFIKPAVAEWCLALKRIGEDELLREWIEKFTDPSDPSALDPINKVFSAYALDLNDSESALEYALKINDAKLRDESILNLAQQFIKEVETTKAGEFLFLLTQVESKTQLAYSLAEDAAYLKSDENAHRLLAACGDSPQSLASILDKLRLANPASEILKIMYKKLSNEIGFSLSDDAIALEAVVVISKLSKVTDSTFLNEAKKAMKTLLKNKPNYV